MAGHCPECGAPVRRTTDGWLRYEDPETVRHLHRMIAGTLRGFWILIAGLLSLLILPLALAAGLDALPPRFTPPVPLGTILTFLPSVALILAALLATIRSVHRIRPQVILRIPAMHDACDRHPVKQPFVAPLLAAACLVAVGGTTYLLVAAAGQASPIPAPLIRAVAILILSSIGVVVIWLDTLVIILRIRRLERWCAEVPDRRHRRLRASIDEVKIIPPLGGILVWMGALAGPSPFAVLRDDPESSLSPMISLLALTALLWLLTINTLHRTRKYVAAEVAAISSAE